MRFVTNKTKLKSLFLVFGILLLQVQTANANNGSVALAYPIKDIVIDGNFMDWPMSATRYPLSHYNGDFSSGGTFDLNGYFRIGYNEAEQALYVAMEVTDDLYVQSPENPQWWAHDMQVLYIDPQHKDQPTGVLAFEATAYFSKIVEQQINWDPYVQNASWDMVECEVVRDGNSTRYEWKITLEGFITPGRTLGFDYAVFDKDHEDSNSDTLSWGTNDGVKHECSQCLGDVLLVPDDLELATLSGRVDLSPKFAKNATLRLISESNQSRHLDIALDSTGGFTQELFPGYYRAFQPTRLFWQDPVHLYRLEPDAMEMVEVKAGGETKIDLPRMSSVLPRPNLIPKEGVLHNTDSDTKNKIDAFVKAYMAHDLVPGASLMVIKEGKPWYYKTYGVQNILTKDAINTNTLFEAASMTKPVFSFVANLMVERGLLDLERPLCEYLPFPELESFPEYKKMTAFHVLTHKSGMPNWGRTLLREPGTEYGYSGEAFEYLKRVIEKITSRKIEDIIRKELIEPQGIGRMEFKQSAGLREVFSRGHMDGTPSIRAIPKEPMVAFSLHTEARAYTDFALTLLQRKGLKPETYKKMMTVHSPFPDNRRETDHPKEGMGLGIALSESEFGKMFYHSGNNGDFKCLFRMYKDLDMGFVVFTNSNTGNFLADDLALFLIEGKKD